MLQSDEADLIGSAAKLDRKFDDIRMKAYEPGLNAFRDYIKERDSHDFRKSVALIINRLDPTPANPQAKRDPALNIAYHHPIEIGEFREFSQKEFNQAGKAIVLAKTAIEEMEKLRPLRDVETSPRWRAAYDLAYAQLLAYRVRLFQYMLAVDKHAKEDPKPKSPKSNRWDRHYAKEMIEPDEQVVKASGVDLKELEAERLKALEMYDFIIKEHPETPWAQRAIQEKGWGFGIAFRDTFYDPKYFDPEELAKIPKF